MLSKEKWLTPFSFIVVVFWVFFGLLLMVSTFIQGWNPSPAISSTPSAIKFTIGAFLSIGATLMLIADRSWDIMNIRWGLEKIGSILSMGAWIAYATAALLQDWRNTGVILLGVAMTSAILVRYSHISAEEKFIRSRVDKIWKSGYPHNL